MNRTFWRKLHLYAGLLAALPLLVAGVTGAVLAFAKELQPYTDARYYQVTAAGEPLPLATVVEGIRAAYPGIRLGHLGVPDAAERPYVIYASQGGEQFMLFADPYSGSVIRKSHDTATVMKVVEKLHRNLLAQQPGRYLMAASTAVMALLSLIGLYLWWPMRRGTVRRTIRRGDLLSWHNLTGLVAVSVLLVIAVTGVTFTFNKSVIPALFAVTGAPPAPAKPTVTPQTTPPVSLAAILASVRAAAPEARISGFSDPAGAGGVYTFNLSYPSEMHPTGWEQLYINPYNGELDGRFNAYDHSFAAAYQRSWWAWHTGEMIGLGGRILWALVSLLVAALSVTGVLMWWRKRRRRASM